VLGPIRSFLRPSGRVLWFGAVDVPSLGATIASAGLRLPDVGISAQVPVTVLSRQ
jgi:hypothetical protein